VGKFVADQSGRPVPPPTTLRTDACGCAVMQDEVHRHTFVLPCRGHAGAVSLCWDAKQGWHVVYRTPRPEEVARG